MHASCILPYGRSYLVCLEIMLGLYHGTPHRPIHAPKNTYSDLQWWSERLSRPKVSRPLPNTVVVRDFGAYSDASSGVGIGIFIHAFGDQWFSWRLSAHWQSDGCDIAWAEAVGFELVVHCLLPHLAAGEHVIIYGDNNGVVQGWRNCCSRNKWVNQVFRRIIAQLEAKDIHVHAKYVPSKENPADGPSRGRFPKTKRLAMLPVSSELIPYIYPSTDKAHFAHANPPTCEQNSDPEFEDFNHLFSEYSQCWQW